MALFRSIPVDVEAIKYCDMKDGEPVFEHLGNSIPSWLWKGITAGIVSFDSAGMKVHGNVVPTNTWVVHDGAFIDTVFAEKFDRTFVPARKALDKMISAPVPLSARKRGGIDRGFAQAVAAVQGVEVTTAEGYGGIEVTDAIPDVILPDPGGYAVVNPTPYAGGTVAGLSAPVVSADPVDSILEQMAAR